MRAGIGYALDAALVGVTAYLLASNPLVHDVRAHGVSVLTRLADGPAAGNHTRAPVFADPVAQKWYDFALEGNLGRYAAADPSLARFHDNNAWLNTLLLPRPVVDALPHVLAVWLRNCLAGWALYYAVGALWCAAIYWVWGRYFFPNAADKPSWDAILTQMQVRGGGSARGGPGGRSGPPRWRVPAG